MQLATLEKCIFSVSCKCTPVPSAKPHLFVVVFFLADDDSSHYEALYIGVACGIVAIVTVISSVVAVVLYVYGCRVKNRQYVLIQS